MCGRFDDDRTRLGAFRDCRVACTTGARQLQFSDERSELFTFDALVTAFESAGGATATSSDGSSGTQSDDGSEALAGTSLLRFTVNPLTGGVSVKLLSGLIN